MLKKIYICESCDKRSDNELDPGWIRIKGSITVGGGGGEYKDGHHWQWYIFSLEGENFHHFCSPKCFEKKTGFHYLKDFTDTTNR